MRLYTVEEKKKQERLDGTLKGEVLARVKRVWHEFYYLLIRFRQCD